MTQAFGGPIDDVAIAAATQLAGLAVTDGWGVVKSLLRRLSRAKDADTAPTKVSLPEPAGDPDAEFVSELAAYLRSDLDLLRAVQRYFPVPGVNNVQVNLQDDAQAGILGSGVQNNQFRS